MYIQCGTVLLVASALPSVIIEIRIPDHFTCVDTVIICSQTEPLIRKPRMRSGEASLPRLSVWWGSRSLRPIESTDTLIKNDYNPFRMKFCPQDRLHSN